MNKPETIFKTLAEIAPSVAFAANWTHDDNAETDWKELTEPGNAFEGESRDNWKPWIAEVTATAIAHGKPLVASEYLGSIWEKATDRPSQSNPEISGYLPQMLRDAADYLNDALPQGSPTQQETAKALHYLDHM